MNKKIISGILAFIITMSFTACSKDDDNDDRTKETKSTTATLETEVSETKETENSKESSSSEISSIYVETGETVSPEETETEATQPSEQIYTRVQEKNDPNNLYYGYYKGPHDWEGAGIKFKVPKGLYLTIDNRRYPEVVSPDALTYKDSIPLMYRPMSELDIFIEPKLIESANANATDGSTLTYESYDKERFENSSFLTDANADITKIDKYEEFDNYKLFTYEDAFQSYEYDVKDISKMPSQEELIKRQKTVTTKVYVAKYLTRSGHMFTVYVKQNSDYAKTYNKILKEIIDTVEDTDIDYIP